MPRPAAALPAALVALALGLSACAPLSEVGRAPALSPAMDDDLRFAMTRPGLPVSAGVQRVPEASLWAGGPQSLLGDRRASAVGDILTVVVEIDDRAEFSNATDRSRDASETMGVPSLFGLPQRLSEGQPEGFSFDPAVDLSSTGSASGEGALRRRERLTLRVAATVLEVLPNGTLRIAGTQEVRVNHELRELLVTGVVRPEDVSRRNEVTYDKIAAARISYGGRGVISAVQQPRWGQQVLDQVLPF